METLTWLIIWTIIDEQMRERKRPPTHPGAILKRHYLQPLKLTVSHVADGLRVSRKTFSKIVNERGSVTPEMALRLARTLDTSPELWLNLQRNYDLWHASHESRDWRKVKVLITYRQALQSGVAFSSQRIADRRPARPQSRRR